MNKQEFLTQLREGLSGLPQEDIDERLTFYSEMIDDRIEDGLSEEAAVCEIGSTDDIITQVISDTPLSKFVKEKVTPRKNLKFGEIVLLVLGSPIWLSLGIAAVTVFISLYIILWSVIISLWAVFAAFAACSFGGIASGIVFIAGGNILIGTAMISTGFICTGLSVFIFCGCNAVTKSILALSKRIIVQIKNCFIKKEVAQ